VGTERGLEARVLPELNLPLETIDISGLVGKGAGEKLSLVPKLIRSLRQSSAILDRFRPDLVVGVGGYASGPALLAAKSKRLPVVIHEQNARPGLTNRLLGKLADRICLTYPESGDWFGRRTVVTGNPVRNELTRHLPMPEGDPVLLVFGGSRGARALNEGRLAALEHMRDWKQRLTIVHQTGTDDVERVRAGYHEAGWRNVEVVPFISDMAAAYARAHLVLCRAGATTIAELTACGRPALLVPYPYAAADHQTVNARALAERGAALMLPQSEMNAGRLASLLTGLLGDRQRLLDMAGAAHALGCPDAADRILDECRTLVRKG
ncbi:MAG: undecaprenyldiphospho-muramoylpentapeptide beta-N-acetylglucosaminyltransferase, partial [Deltaproteobacteria bacterium]